MSFFGDERYQKTLNLTLSSFEHPTLNVIERYLAPLVIVFTTIAYVTFIYVVATQTPKSMKSYSRLLVYQVSATFAFDATLFLFQPVFIFPYTGVYSNAPWELGDTGNSILFLCLILNTIINYHSLLIQLVFRLASLYTSKTCFTKLSDLKTLLFSTLPVLGLLMGSMCGK